MEDNYLNTLLRDPQVTTLWVSGKTYRLGKTISMHQHDFFQLQYVLNGNEKIIIDSKKYLVKKNNIILIKSNAQHQYSFLESSKILDIKFTLNTEFANFISELFINPLFQIDDEFIIENSRLLLRLVTSFADNDENTLIEIDTRLKLLLLQIFRLRKNKISAEELTSIGTSVLTKASKASEMIDFIQKNYATDITLSQLEKIFHYSKQNIIKIFKESTGYTPVKYLQSIRIEKSIDLLQNTDYTIKDIAIKVGFSANYYPKIFLKNKHILPNKYRKEYQRKQLETITLSADFDTETQPKT